MVKRLAMASIFIVLCTVFAAAQVTSFSKQESLYGVKFAVTSPNKNADNTVTIKTTGLTRNLKITKKFEGRVLGMAAADTNLDGAPEIYVWGISSGSGSYGIILGFSTNGKKSATEIYFPEMDMSSEMANGYMGHDEFEVIETTLVRRFPVYKPGDSNAKATGGTRQVQYKVKKGEAGWVMSVEKFYSF